MKRLLIFLVIVFYGNMALIAQDLCGTPSPTPPFAPICNRCVAR